MNVAVKIVKKNKPDPRGMSDEELDHTPMDFGQYKGQTPSQVSEHDPAYLVWCADRFDNRKVASDILIQACREDA